MYMWCLYVRPTGMQADTIRRDVLYCQVDAQPAVQTLIKHFVRVDVRQD
jgi:hypothetical protein